jgi:putative Mn2+ efflux pump MntP
MSEIVILAFALSMDAFAVSIGLGSKQCALWKGVIVKTSLTFGLFQAFMPLVGYFGGVGLRAYINTFDHWIAFGLLVFIGIKMIHESFGQPIEEEYKSISNKTLLALGFATSIDAMAAGFSLGFIEVPIYISSAIIGVITIFMSGVGIYVGCHGAQWMESKAEIFGGIVLIGIGIKILAENIF